jgi:hypothetical protein
MTPMLDITEQMTLATAARLLPGRNGKSISVKTLYRWIICGVRGVHLEASRVGGMWYTTAESMENFRRNCTSKRSVGNVDMRTKTDEAASVKRARKSLEALGFYGQKPKGVFNGRYRQAVQRARSKDQQ